jgi:hypothetical protein
MALPRRLLTAFALSLLVASVGCKDSGPPRYRISGAVTLDGKPIPYGEIIFTPDGTKNNAGPQGIAEIRDGRYDTAFVVPAKGIAGGPTILLVNGMSGPGGKTLCEYKVQADLPRSDSTLDLDVPKKAATRPKPAKEI